MVGRNDCFENPQPEFSWCPERDICFIEETSAPENEKKALKPSSMLDYELFARDFPPTSVIKHKNECQLLMPTSNCDVCLVLQPKLESLQRKYMLDMDQAVHKLEELRLQVFLC